MILRSPKSHQIIRDDKQLLGKKLPRSYYQSTDVLFLAKDLLGKNLMTHLDGVTCGGMIVETEAYRAPDDRACHAYNNLRTKRTEVMFAEGGKAYIYLCYGIHHLMNVVTGPEGMAHAVLIRAIEPSIGIDLMAKRRNLASPNIRISNGPGSLSVALGLNTTLSGSSLVDKNASIWIEGTNYNLRTEEICCGPRIGIDGSGEAAKYPWRFFLKNNKYVSASRSCS